MKGIGAFCLAVLLVFTGCKTGKPDTKNPENNGKLLLTMERTPCFGGCPIYEIKVYESGLLLYNGKRFTPKTGCWYTKVSKADIKALKAVFHMEGFMEMDAEYPRGKKAPVDLPGCVLTYYYNANEPKKVTDKGWDSPEPLKRLQARVDSLAAPEKLRSCDK
ncbi:MAG: DUF6438 domain-containing protein [Chitinophagales bacterium]